MYSLDKPAHMRMTTLENASGWLTAGNAQITATILIEALALDDNPVVRHEVAFILGLLRRRGWGEPNLIRQALSFSAENDKSALVRHEAIEALGNFEFDEVKGILDKAQFDPCPDVVATALLVAQQLEARSLTAGNSFGK